MRIPEINTKVYVLSVCSMLILAGLLAERFWYGTISLICIVVILSIIKFSNSLKNI